MMKHAYNHYRCSLGLSFALTACGDPSQFNELMSGEPIYVDQKIESTPSAAATETPETTTTATASETNTEPVTYTGEVPMAPPIDAGKPAEDISAATPPTLFADCDDHPEKGIVAGLFSLPDGTNHLPDFSSASSLRNVCLSELNIKDRQFSEGFPGVEDLFEWFGLDMHFQVNAPKKGTYEFTLQSDDGAILWIDNNKVIDNDGLHAVTSKKAKVYLDAGPHVFHVSYYQGPRWRIALELFWKTPGTSTKVYIPASAISRVDI